MCLRPRRYADRKCSGGGGGSNSTTTDEEDDDDCYQGSKDRPEGDEFFDELKEFAKAGEESSDDVGFIDGKLRYVEIDFTSTMLREQSSYTITLAYYDKVHEAVRNIVSTIDNGDKLGSSPFVFADSAFTWVVTEKALVDGVFQGFAICFPVAFVVLLVATGSPRLSLFAIVAIALIVGVTLGFCQAVMGWALGVAESIASIIVIGLSVDFSLHLAHQYMESEEHTREGKTKDALVIMGSTVLAGAVTTLGAGSFMWPAQVRER